jgi:hypothetical protein
VKEGNMDHNEVARKFGLLMLIEADHGHEVATELEALVSLPPMRNLDSLHSSR